METTSGKWVVGVLAALIGGLIAWWLLYTVNPLYTNDCTTLTGRVLYTDYTTFTLLTRSGLARVALPEDGVMRGAYGPALGAPPLQAPGGGGEVIVTGSWAGGACNQSVFQVWNVVPVPGPLSLFCNLATGLGGLLAGRLLYRLLKRVFGL